MQTVPASDIHRITHAANRVVSHARGQLNNILAVLCFERFVFLLFRLGGFYMNMIWRIWCELIYCYIAEFILQVNPLRNISFFFRLCIIKMILGYKIKILTGHKKLNVIFM